MSTLLVIFGADKKAWAMYIGGGKVQNEMRSTQHGVVHIIGKSSF